MRKLFSLFILTTFSCFANYVCDPSNPCNPKDPCDACKSCDPCAIPCPVLKKAPKPAVCAYNAPYKTEVICPWETYISISYLLWEAKMDNLQYGDIRTTTLDLLEVDYIDLTTFNSRLNVDFSYKSGFQLAVGFICNPDNWDFLAEYTFHRSSVDSSDSVATNAFTNDGSYETEKYINGYFFTHEEQASSNLGLDENFFPYNASGKWDVDLDVGDLELGRQYYVGKYLLFRPFSSLRLAWIRQTYLAKYDGPVAINGNEAFNNPGGTNGSFTFSNKSTAKSWGVGPRFGLDTSWMFCGNYRAFSDIAGSLLYTNYYNLSAVSKTNIYDSSNALFESINGTTEEQDDYSALRPQLELTLGLGWGCNFDCNRWYLDLTVGYTFNVFWNQNLFYNVFDEYVRNTVGDPGTVMEKTNTVWAPKGGDLSYQGLIISARLDF